MVGTPLLLSESGIIVVNVYVFQHMSLLLYIFCLPNDTKVMHRLNV